VRINVALGDEQFAVTEDQGSGNVDDWHGDWCLRSSNS